MMAISIVKFFIIIRSKAVLYHIFIHAHQGSFFSWRRGLGLSSLRFMVLLTHFRFILIFSTKKMRSHRFEHEHIIVGRGNIYIVSLRIKEIHGFIIDPDFSKLKTRIKFSTIEILTIYCPVIMEILMSQINVFILSEFFREFFR